MKPQPLHMHTRSSSQSYCYVINYIAIYVAIEGHAKPFSERCPSIWSM